MADITGTKTKVPTGTVGEQFGARKVNRDTPSPVITSKPRLNLPSNTKKNGKQSDNNYYYYNEYYDHKAYIKREGFVNYFSSALGLEHIIYNKPYTPHNPYNGLTKHAASRKAALDNIKVEPKVFFANERTFLTWMHTSITLASISVAIISFSTPSQEDMEAYTGGVKPWIFPQIYGLTLLPISVFFIFYALYQYTNRANMINKREPGPYEDITGPSIMAAALVGAVLINFIVEVFNVAEEE